MQLIPSEVVEVVRPVVALDELGETTNGDPKRELVENVSVQPFGTADLSADRPDGSRVEWTLYFPKTYKKSLRGCEVVVRGDTYAVVGDPQPWSEHVALNPWNRVVVVVKVDG